MSLNENLKERDWKYLRSIHDEMLHELCSRINEQAASIATSDEGNPHERYLKLYRHIQDSEEIIADCFNDWRRTNIHYKILFLRRHGLFRDEHAENLSERAREWFRGMEEWHAEQ